MENPMYNHVVLVRFDRDGLLHLVRADEYSISDGELIGFLNPNAFNADDLYDMYNELASNEDFEIEPLNYRGNTFNTACKIARQTHPGGWEPSEDFDGYVCYNGAYPFMVEGKWYSIYFYWVDILDI